MDIAMRGYIRMTDARINDRVWIRYYRRGAFQAEMTFIEVLDQASRLSDCLIQSGLVAGDRVIVHLRNSPEAVIAYLALREVQLIAVPVNPKESPNWLRFVQEHAAARAAITERGLILYEATPQAIAVNSGALMTIIYTSGTTGISKGVCLGWAQWQANALALNRHHAMTNETIHASPLPLFHCNAHGFSMVGTYLARCRWILFDQVTTSFLDRINEEHVQIVSLVPAVLAQLLRKRPDWRPHAGLRYIVTAAAPLSAALLRSVLETWNVRVIQGFGLSESTNFSCTMPIDLPDDIYRHIMFPHPSVGVQLPGVEITIGQDDQPEVIGELHIRSSSNFLGYWRDEARVSDWVATGDLGYYRVVDGRRFYYLCGRIKEQINRGGEKLNPVVLEEDLRQLGMDGEFAIVPIPDPDLGEEVALISMDRIDERIVDKLPWYRRPKKIVIVDQIPRTATGKVLRRKAAELAI